MLLSIILVTVAFIEFCSCVPFVHVEHERRDLSALHESGWLKGARAPSNAMMRVRIALTQRNLGEGNNLLMKTSDPDSESYGQWLGYSEIAKLFEPQESSIVGVQQWLSDEGIHLQRHSYSRGRGTVTFDGTIAEIESLLRTEYNVFEHVHSGKKHIATDAYNIPQHLSQHIHFITPTIALHPISKTSRSVKRDGISGPLLQSTSQAMNTSDDLSNCSDGVTPACIRAMYGVPRGNSSLPGNEMGIFEQGSSWAAEELDLFFKHFPGSGVPVGTRPIVKSIDGGVAPVKSGSTDTSEGLLDLEVSMPLIYPQKVIEWQVDDPNYGDVGFLDTFWDALDASFCTYRGGDDPQIDPHYPDPKSQGWHHPEMCGKYKPSNVISMSYSWYEFQMPDLYQERMCHEFMKMSLAGISLFSSSSDFGPHCNDSTGQPLFSPKAPAACPYVTNVGGTMLVPGAPVTARQVAYAIPSLGAQSGGGFSGRFARPRYQAEAVQSYLDNHVPALPAATFNRSGRGYPDVAAVAVNVTVFLTTSLEWVGGTSASTPLWASLITLVNERRLAAGKSTVGFINPTLYKNKQIFTDIVEGGNDGVPFAGAEGSCKGLGFNATEGWDPVTGLGTPKFDELLNVFMSLP